MLIQRIPKEKLPAGKYKAHNVEATVVSMTKDEAVRLICQLSRSLGTPGMHSSNAESFPDGLWEEKDLAFCVMDDKTFMECRQELREEKLP